MKALVIGATGYTGGHVVRQLLARNIETTAHVRPESRHLSAIRKAFEALGAKVEPSAWEPEALLAAVRRSEPELVFALLGTTRKRAARERIQGDIYEAVEGRLTRMLVDATRQATPQARLVFLSSVGTTAETKNPYLKARAAIERYCLDSGLRVTIARAPFITGPDRNESRPGERLAATVADMVLLLGAALGGAKLRQRYQSLTGEQLARCLVHAAVDPSCAGATLEPEQLRTFLTL